MARIGRLKVIGDDAFYHIISRTVGQDFLLHDQEKQRLFDIIKRYSVLFFVKVIGYAIMSNHFHLLAAKFGTNPHNKFCYLPHGLTSIFYLFYNGKLYHKKGGGKL